MEVFCQNHAFQRQLHVPVEPVNTALEHAKGDPLQVYDQVEDSINNQVGSMITRYLKNRLCRSTVSYPLLHGYM